MVLLNNASFISEFELKLCYSWCPHGLFFSEAFVYLIKVPMMGFVIMEMDVFYTETSSN